MWQNLLILNAIDLLAVSIAMAKMIAWSTKTRGVRPSRKNLIVFASINLAIWIFSNIMFFYFRSHPQVVVR
jgi:hypothetical protein